MNTKDAIEQFGWYLLHVNDTPAEDVHMTLEKNLQRREGTFMSTAEKLRREGHAEGRAATLLQLRELAGLLVEIHGQHEHQALLERNQRPVTADMLLRLARMFGGDGAVLPAAIVGAAALHFTGIFAPGVF